MALTINSYSNFGNKPITLTIDGTTPQDLILAADGITIDYEPQEINKPITDWKGSLSFLGTPDLYNQFGLITKTSHQVTITYDDKKWIGYLDPSVYDVANTGYDEVFTLNVNSSLDNIRDIQFDENVSMYSIDDLFNIIKSKTLLDDIIIKKSFTENLNMIQNHSKNFQNDDNDFETYYTILEWICTSFGFKAIINDQNELIVTSYELLYNSSNVWNEKKHSGINESYSVGSLYNSGRVIASNYQMDPITANFNINGDDLLVWGITGEKRMKTFWVNNSMMINPYPSLPSGSVKHP
jgi:hypothetical protein